MDLHPIFVHFPVALISLFAVLELVPLEKKLGKNYFFTKFTFLFFGVFLSIPAYMTGGIAGEVVERGPLHNVVELHGFFAGTTIVVAIVLLLIYAVRFGLEYRDTLSGKCVSHFIPERVLTMTRPCTARGIVVFLAVALLLLVTITGALGGSMVYGPDVDPIAKVLYKIFGL